LHREDNSGSRDFRSVQREFAAQIRMPCDSALHGIEPRRLKIYQDLCFNNIESFLASGFPVLRSLYDEASWFALVRQFMHGHACSTPYFLQIGTELLDFLEKEHTSGSADPAFIKELAHYEWVELALDIADAEIPDDADVAGPLLDARLDVSPLAWPLVYEYPVHKINAQFRPDAPPDEPTCLLVYRNRADVVQFIETNPITVHLLQMLGEASTLTAREVLQQMAVELGYDTDQEFVAFGGATLESFHQLDIVTAR
jgi:uncharacterized protein